MTLTLTGLVAITLMLTGCATTPATRPAPAVDVTGRWSGVLSAAFGEYSATMSLQQTGAKVAGEINFGTIPQSSGPIQGTVSGDTFDYSGPNATGAEMTVKGNEMQGRTYHGSRLYMKRD